MVSSTTKVGDTTMGVLGNIFPLILLILFGYVLGRINFFEEITFKQIQKFLLRVTIPSILFTAFATMELQLEYVNISVGIFIFMVCLLILGFVLYRLLPIKHDFFIFYLTTFGFGTVGLPVFLDIFGFDNATGMAMLGVGHEIFVAAVLFPALSIYFDKSGGKIHKIFAKAFLSPTIIMVVSGIIINVTSFRQIMSENVFGASLLDAVARVGGLTIVITLVLTGYRMNISNKNGLKTSAKYATIRLIVTLPLAILFNILFLSNLSSSPPYLSHAFYILVFQHPAIMLVVFVGQFRSVDDQTIASNAFVISTAAGIILFIIYMMRFVGV